MFFLLEAFFFRSFKKPCKIHGLNPYEDQLSITLRPSHFVSSVILMCFMFVGFRDVHETSIHELTMRYSVCGFVSFPLFLSVSNHLEDYEELRPLVMVAWINLF